MEGRAARAARRRAACGCAALPESRALVVLFLCEQRARDDDT